MDLGISSRRCLQEIRKMNEMFASHPGLGKRQACTIWAALLQVRTGGPEAGPASKPQI